MILKSRRAAWTSISTSMNDPSLVRSSASTTCRRSSLKAKLTSRTRSEKAVRTMKL
jgi:hypothetical protein